MFFVQETPYLFMPSMNSALEVMHLLICLNMETFEHQGRPVCSGLLSELNLFFVSSWQRAAQPYFFQV